MGSLSILSVGLLRERATARPARRRLGVVNPSNGQRIAAAMHAPHPIADFFSRALVPPAPGPLSAR
jgi:hypothetical protein